VHIRVAFVVICANVCLSADGIAVQDEGEMENHDPSTEAVDLDTEQGRNALMMRLYRAATSKDAQVRAKAYEVLSYVSTSKYLYMSHYVRTLVDQTVKAMKEDEDVVISKVLELWASLAEMESLIEEANGPTHGFILAHAPEVVPAILDHVLSRPLSDPDHIEPILTSPEMKSSSLTTNAALTLWSITSILPGAQALTLIAPFVAKNISTSNPWHLRRASMVALGVLARYDEAETLVKSSLPLVLNCSSAPQLALMDMASTCLSRIVEGHFHLIEVETLNSIVQWMQKLDVSNASHFAILSFLLDSITIYISFGDEEEPLADNFNDCRDSLLKLFVKWAGSKDAPKTGTTWTSIFECMSSFIDLGGIEDGDHQEMIETICAHLTERLEDTFQASSKVAASLLGVFNAALASNYVSVEASTKLASTTLARLNKSNCYEEVQEGVLALSAGVGLAQESFAPFVGPICDYIVHIIQSVGNFTREEEDSYDPSEGYNPEEDDDDLDDAACTTPDFVPQSNVKSSPYPTSTNETGSSSSQNVTSKDSSKPARSSSFGKNCASGSGNSRFPNSLAPADVDALVAYVSGESGTTTGAHTTGPRQIQHRNIASRLSAKGLVIEDCLRLIELMMDTLPEAMAPHVASLRTEMLQLVLRVPSKFVLIQASLTACLASIARNDANSARVLISPVLKFIDQISKLIDTPEKHSIYDTLVSSFQSILLSVDRADKIALSTAASESFEVMLSLIKSSTKKMETTDTDELVGSCITLLGDYASTFRKSITNERLERMKSTLAFLQSQWEAPDEKIWNYTSKAFHSLDK
jgi:hypothetical protein